MKCLYFPVCPALNQNILQGGEMAERLREKGEKTKEEEYPEGLHTLPHSGAPVKANQILSHDLL